MPKRGPVEDNGRYDMEPPNKDLPYRGGLPVLTLPARSPGHLARWAFAGPNGLDTWLDPGLVEAALDDPALVKAVTAAVAAGKGRDAAIQVAARHVDRVFGDVILVDVVARFDAVAPLVAAYAVAKAEARLKHPGDKRFVLVATPDTDEEDSDGE